MKIHACDVCFYEDHKLIEAEWKKGIGDTPKIDICKDHRNWGEGKTAKEFSRSYLALVEKSFAQ